MSCNLPMHHSRGLLKGSVWYGHWWDAIPMLRMWGYSKISPRWCESQQGGSVGVWHLIEITRHAV
jgi:hypothetical protein